jgi:ATP-dependent Lon protease
MALADNTRQRRHNAGDRSIESQATELCILWLCWAQEQEWFKRLPEGYRRFDLQRMVLLLKNEQTGRIEKVKADLHIHFPPRSCTGNGSMAASIGLALTQVMRGLPFTHVIGALGEFGLSGELLPVWPAPEIEWIGSNMAHAFFYAAPPENEENLEPTPGEEGMEFRGFSHMDKMLQYAYKWDRQS